MCANTASNQIPQRHSYVPQSKKSRHTTNVSRIRKAINDASVLPSNCYSPTLRYYVSSLRYYVLRIHRCKNQRGKPAGRGFLAVHSLGNTERKSDESAEMRVRQNASRTARAFSYIRLFASVTGSRNPRKYCFQCVSRSEPPQQLTLCHFRACVSMPKEPLAGTHHRKPFTDTGYVCETKFHLRVSSPT